MRTRLVFGVLGKYRPDFFFFLRPGVRELPAKSAILDVIYSEAMLLEQATQTIRREKV